MKNVHFLIIFILLTFLCEVHAQDKRVYGKIFDAKTNQVLEYVNVKVADTSYGTTSDKNGSYFIKLSAGAHKLIFSSIGYFTDTADVYIQDSNFARNTYLRPSEIMTEIIEVLGEDPAYDIIRKAIKYKKQFKEKLNEYHYDAYTKYIIRSNQSSVSSDSLTTEKYPILAVLESETEGYFKKPDKYKEIVKSKRETANINRGFAIPFIVNFYDESLDLGEVKITGPLADDALDYYSYKLLAVTSIDSLRVFKIRADGSGMLPMFDGNIYISDSTFALMKVDLSVNESAKPTAIDELNFKQKFSAYTDGKNSGNKFWLPTDIQIYAEGGIAGLFGFTGDVFTIISNYEINKKIPPGIFNDYAIQVLPDAKKDSVYWSEHQLVKSSREEKKAFVEIEKKSAENSKSIRLGLSNLKIGKYINSYPLNYFRYNRVEGSHLQFNLSFAGKNRRLRMDSFLGYGFSDKKTKYEVNLSIVPDKKRNLRIEAGIFRRLQPLSFNLSGIYSAYNSLLGLFDKQDLFDYYYASGFEFKISRFIIPQIRLSAKYHEEKQTSAFKNTDFSIRKKDQLFRGNPAIYDGFQRILGLSVLLDPNKYKFIDYGDGDVSRFTETNYPTLELGIETSSKKLNSSFEYNKFSALLRGENYFNKFLNISYKAAAVYFKGDVPVQTLAAFNSVNGSLSPEFSFRTMGYREYLGDKLYYLSLENNFGNLFWYNVPFFKKIKLIGFLNAGKSEISTNTAVFMPGTELRQTNNFYMESGFGLGGIFDIIRVDFAWRLNNRKDGRNFNFSISIPGF